MILTLVRHTSVEEAYKNCYNGHNKISLSSEGKKEAKRVAKLLKSKDFDAVYCSDLPRAKETLEAFKELKNITFTKLLREKSWGRHEGMSFDEIVKKEKIEYKNFLQWIDALDGEDYELYTKRVKMFFLDFLPLQDKKNILIMTHAGVVYTLISIIKQIPLEEAFSFNFRCGCFVELDLDTFTLSNVKCI